MEHGSDSDEDHGEVLGDEHDDINTEWQDAVDNAQESELVVDEHSRKECQTRSENAKYVQELKSAWPSLGDEIDEDAKRKAAVFIQTQKRSIVERLNEEMSLAASAFAWMKLHELDPVGLHGNMSLLRINGFVTFVNWTEAGVYGRLVRLDVMERPIWTTNSQCALKRLDGPECQVIIPSTDSKCLMVKGPKPGVETTENLRPEIPRDVLRLFRMAQLASDAAEDLTCELCSATVDGVRVVKCPCCSLVLHASCTADVKADIDTNEAWRQLRAVQTMTLICGAGADLGTQVCMICH